MVHHQHDSLDYWTLPGGGVEYDETPEQAAIFSAADVPTGLTKNQSNASPLFSTQM